MVFSTKSTEQSVFVSNLAFSGLSKHFERKRKAERVPFGRDFVTKRLILTAEVAFVGRPPDFLACLSTQKNKVPPTSRSFALFIKFLSREQNARQHMDTVPLLQKQFFL